jgi:acetyl-CoA carboxylase biotin carboxyl carrier protein
MAKKKTNFKEETKIVQQISPVSTMPPPMVQQQVIAEVTKAEKKEETKEDSNLVTIKAQMIGTFYRSSAPEKPPFVEVGSIIKPGNTLCIIEAMKLFNEIESEVSGKIVKILVDDVSPIEFDQPLFLIDPNI